MLLVNVFKSRTIKLRVSGFTLFIVLLLLFTGSCGGQAPETAPPSTPAPAPTEPPATEPEPEPSQTEGPVTSNGVSIDGTISEGEYAEVAIYNSYEIHWTSDEQFIYIGLKAGTRGWVALGIQPGSRMKDSDMIFGFVTDGVATVYDHYSTGNFGPHVPDTELGGSSDILESAGSEKDGNTIIEFKRALNTGDEYDIQIIKGKNKIIWAYGLEDTTGLKHSARGYGELDI